MEHKHHYGKLIHILNHSVLLSLLAKFGHPKTEQPEIAHLLRAIYLILAAQALARELPLQKVALPTRMKIATPRGVFRGEIVRRNTKVVVAAVARAGLVPAQVCYELLTTILEPRMVRMDYITMARTTNRQGQVTGSHFGDSKIGGSLRDAILVIPDPMGATGATIFSLLQAYKQNYGAPKKILLLPMIAAPEFLFKVQHIRPRPVVYLGRLDRGLSTRKVLQAAPGRYWAQEKGLNEHQYIVPGAGGIGEIMTNSWV